LELLPAELFQFQAQPVPQGTFRTQLIEQGFGLLEGLARKITAPEEPSPASVDLLFG